jgi:hypothetical protein
MNRLSNRKLKGEDIAAKGKPVDTYTIKRIHVNIV